MPTDVYQCCGVLTSISMSTARFSLFVSILFAVSAATPIMVGPGRECTTITCALQRMNSSRSSIQLTAGSYAYEGFSAEGIDFNISISPFQNDIVQVYAANSSQMLSFQFISGGSVTMNNINFHFTSLAIFDAAVVTFVGCSFSAMLTPLQVEWNQTAVIGGLLSVASCTFTACFNFLTVRSLISFT